MTKEESFRTAGKLAARSAYVDGHVTVDCGCGLALVAADRDALRYVARGHLLRGHTPGNVIQPV